MPTIGHLPDDFLAAQPIDLDGWFVYGVSADPRTDVSNEGRLVLGTAAAAATTGGGGLQLLRSHALNPTRQRWSTADLQSCKKRV